MDAVKRSAMTAGELMRQLEADPEFVARRAEKAARHAQRAEICRKAEAPFLEALAKSGFQVANVDDIARTFRPLPQSLIDLLIEWIPQVEHPKVQEMMTWQLLAAPRRSLDGRFLTALYDSTCNDQLKWVIADVIEQTQPSDVEAWLPQAIQNWRSGNARILLASAITKMLPTAQAIPILVTVFDDILLGAADALGKIGDRDSLSFLSSKLLLASGVNKRAIQKAITRIENRLRKIEARSERDGTQPKQLKR